MRKTALTYGAKHNRRMYTDTSQEFASVYKPKKIFYGSVLLPNHKQHCRTLPFYRYSEEAFSHVRKRSFLQRNKLHGKFATLGKFVSIFVRANLLLRHIVFLPTGKLTSTRFMCIPSWLVGRRRRLFSVRSCSWVLFTIRYILSSKCSCYRAEWLGRRSRGFFYRQLGNFNGMFPTVKTKQQSFYYTIDDSIDQCEPGTKGTFYGNMAYVLARLGFPAMKQAMVEAGPTPRVAWENSSFVLLPLLPLLLYPRFLSQGFAAKFESRREYNWKRAFFGARSNLHPDQAAFPPVSSFWTTLSFNGFNTALSVLMPVF